MYSIPLCLFFFAILSFFLYCSFLIAFYLCYHISFLLSVLLLLPFFSLVTLSFLSCFFFIMLFIDYVLPLSLLLVYSLLLYFLLTLFVMFCLLLLFLFLLPRSFLSYFLLLLLLLASSSPFLVSSTFHSLIPTRFLPASWLIFLLCYHFLFSPPYSCLVACCYRFTSHLLILFLFFLFFWPSFSLVLYRLSIFFTFAFYLSISPSLSCYLISQLSLVSIPFSSLGYSCSFPFSVTSFPVVLFSFCFLF